VGDHQHDIAFFNSEADIIMICASGYAWQRTPMRKNLCCTSAQMAFDPPAPYRSRWLAWRRNAPRDEFHRH
jgi:hypothetical protein